MSIVQHNSELLQWWIINDFLEADEKNSSWLSNPSYEKFEPPPPQTSNVNENSNQSDEDAQPSTSHTSGHTSRSHKKKHKKDRKSKKEKTKIVQVMEFDGNEDYYVDKKAERGYLRVQTLHKPACPR